ncbi:respiratory chain complex I subunit 1 family protein [Methanothermococcus okinawensis]|nr:NADH-quinone oxidoreductase subunit H [Methanothermococcus okinawensis]
MIEEILSILGVPLIAFGVSTWIPGINRKIQARIQQRIGPSILTPGFWALFKFLAKKTKEPYSTMPKLYKFLPIVSFIAIWLILASTSITEVKAVSNLIFIVGLLKIEEMDYVIMGSLASSVMGVRMPYVDECKGSNFLNTLKMSLEQLGAVRAFKMITIGSFPFYTAMFIPFIAHKSIYLDSIVGNNFLFTIGGIFGAIAYFIGYLVLTNDYPFAIMHTKADVIEGPTLEYSGKYRAIYLSVKELLMITLGSLFATLYLGIAPEISNPITIVENFAVALIFPILSSVVSAYSPVLTYRQLYPISLYTTIIAFIGLIFALLGL